jgi:hypothetical protein
VSTETALETLRRRYIAIGCVVGDGSRAAKVLGSGHRILFVAACDGRNLVVYTTAGTRHKLPKGDIHLDSVYDVAGKRCKYQVSRESGWLQVLGRSYVDSDGVEVEEWSECFPWTKYDLAASESVRRALRESVVDGEESETVLFSSDGLF